MKESNISVFSDTIKQKTNVLESVFDFKKH